VYSHEPVLSITESSPVANPASPISVPSLQPSPMLAQDAPLFSLSFDLPLREARDAFERAYFEHHLMRENGSMTRVAEKTGLERTHLYRKLKQLGVEPGKAARKG
jgi:DNA-binding NtrC family response regulator